MSLTLKGMLRAVLSLAGGIFVVLGLVAVPLASADPCTVLLTLPGGVVQTVPVDATPGVIPSLDIPAGTVSEKMICRSPATSSSSTTITTTTTTTTTLPATSSSSTTTTTTTTTTSPTSSSSSSSSSTTTSSSTSTSPSPSQPPVKTKTTTTTTHASSTTPHPTSTSPEKRSRHRQTPPKSAAHKRGHKKHKPAARKHKHRSPRAKPPTGEGVPKASNPAFSLTLPGPAPIGVPNFFIDSFRIPPFLIPIYQAAGIEYQVPWQVLGAINEIETDYGRNLSVSSANAVGWMQFLPSTWRQWGVDANGDGVADPYNPVDAIFAAARYLHAAGASTSLPRAIFAYNHAGWYVQSVLLRAKLIGGIPSQLVSALAGLVQGHFPVAAPAKYADDSVVSLSKHRVKGSNAAIAINSDPNSKGTSIFARKGSPVIAVNDGKIVKVGSSRALGHYVQLQDSTGNIYTYAHLGSVAKTYPVPKPVKITAKDIARELAAPKIKAPSAPASAGQQQTTAAPTAPSVKQAKPVRGVAKASRTPAVGSSSTGTISAPLVKERLFAHPARAASYAAGGKLQLRNSPPQLTSFDHYFSDALHLGKKQYTLKHLRTGAIVIAGTILGRIGGASEGLSPHVYFTIQPAGKGAPDIDPKPILDGWKLLAATAVYRASDLDPFSGPGAKNPTVGQVLLMSKQQLTLRVLSDPQVRIYNCGRRDIQSGQIDRRVLATIEFLSASGLSPYVSGLKCGASVNARTGTDPQGATGESVDISKINDIPVAGHQGPGSITDMAIRRLLTLQGSMRPDEIISDIAYKSQPNTLALPDHRNRIQITYTPDYGTNKKLSQQIKSILEPGQWEQLINRISQIPEPVVPIAPSKYALRTHRG
jgi:hypothetical protein